MRTAKEGLRQQRLEEQKEHERKVRESHEAQKRKLEHVERERELKQVERERELKQVERERNREPTEFGDFVGFILLSIITLGIYAVYYFWKKARVDSNLLRAILSNLELPGSNQTTSASIKQDLP